MRVSLNPLRSRQSCHKLLRMRSCRALAYLLVLDALRLASAFAITTRPGFCVRCAGCPCVRPARRPSAPHVKMQNRSLPPWAHTSVRDLKERPLLAAGDAAALFLFAGIGRMNHRSDDGSVFLTALPFLICWFLVAPALGAYKTEDPHSVRQALTRALPAWLLAVPMGCFSRGLLLDRMPAAPFWVVALLSTGVLLGGWRAAYCQAAAVTKTVNEFTEAILDDDDD